MAKVSGNFETIDAWKEKFVTHTQDTGSFSGDKQWQLQFFEFDKSHKSMRQSHNNLIRTSLRFESIEELKKAEEAAQKETGESVLMLGKIFHEKVLFIKNQLGFV